jgi:hypothetical protein
MPPEALSLLLSDFLLFPPACPILSQVSAVIWYKYGTVELCSDAPPAVSCSTDRLFGFM